MKIGALIPVRLASERLPGKALLALNDRPVLYHLLDRVARSRHISDLRDIVLCTTTDSTDDPLVSAVDQYGASVYRGSIHDIIRRFSDAMSAFGFDAVIQANGDNPLTATEYMDLTMDRLVADRSADIVTVKGLPLGAAVTSFTRQAMDKVVAAYQTVRNDTGFIYFFTKTGLCRHVEIECSAAHQHDGLRLTLDYPVDLELFRRIFEALDRPGVVFGIADVIAFMRAHPDLAELNRGVDAEYWSRTADKARLEYVDNAGTVRTVQL